MPLPIISLDFWNTIAIPNPDYSTARMQTLMDFHPNTEEACKTAHRESKQQFDRLAVYDGIGYSVLECYGSLVRRLDPELFTGENKHNSYARVKRLRRDMEAVAERHPPMLNYQVVDAIRKLNQLEYTICITSNTNLISGQLIRQLLHRANVYVDSYAFSDELGYAKPSVDIFIHQVKQLAVTTSEMLHIGDSQECDINGADRLGIKTVLVKNPSETAKVLNLIIQSHES